MASHLNEQISKGYIHFSAILEIVGKPQEHVDSTFAEFIAQMKKSLKYEVVSSVVHESIPVDGSENLYSSFAEIEILARNMGALFDFCFECMPASVEILAPSELKLKPDQASAAVNDLIGRIHHLDMQSKQLTQQIGLYSQNLNIMIENAVVLHLRQKPHNIQEISVAVGVPVEKLKSFMSHLLEKGRLTETNGVYGVSGRSVVKKEHVIESDAVVKLPAMNSKSISKSNVSKIKAKAKTKSKK